MIRSNRAARMRRPVKARLVLSALAATAALAVAGCGGSSDSSADPATLAPPKSPLFIEASVRPEGELKTNIDSLAKSIGGVDDLGGLIVSELENAARRRRRRTRLRQGSRTVAGRKGRALLPGLRRRGLRRLWRRDSEHRHRRHPGLHRQASASESEEPVKEAPTTASTTRSRPTTRTTFVAVVGDFLVVAEDKPTFEAMVDASNGESLADEETYASTVERGPQRQPRRRLRRHRRL